MINSFQHIIVVGDIHSDISDIITHQKIFKLTNTLFLQAGDFGIGFSPEQDEITRLKYFNELFKNKNNYLYACRGNHDNPKYFDEKYHLSNIKLMPDYSTLQFEYCNEIKTVLFIGGAISVDRLHRKAYYTNGDSGSDYWFDEAIKYDPIVQSITDIDMVISHSNPNFCQPLTKWSLTTLTCNQYTKNCVVNPNIEITKITDKLYQLNDINLINDITNERALLTKIYNELRLNNELLYWCNGHFHEFSHLYYQDTKFITVANNEFYEITYI